MKNDATKKISEAVQGIKSKSAPEEGKVDLNRIAKDLADRREAVLKEKGSS